MPLHSEKLTIESLYCIVVACNHPRFISIYGGQGIHLRSAWTADLRWIPCIQELMSPLPFFFPNKGSIVLVSEKAAVSKLGGFARGAPTLFCPPTQVFHCSHEKRSVRWQPGNLPVICRRDCHHVGRLGRSASPHAAERPRMGLTTNNTLENTHGAWYFTDDR